MEILSVGEFKSRFSEVLKKVASGQEIGISYGKRKEVIAKIIPETEKKRKRKIGFLEDKVKVKFSKDFKITEEEFLSL